MRESEAPSGDDEIQTDSRRLTPSPSSGPSTDSANEDFLFHLYRGSELLQDNRVHEAKEELERALHLQPRDTKGQDLLAVVYFRLGHYARAIQIYEQLRRRNANDTSLLLNLSLCYLKTGQPQAARRDLEHLVALVPTHSRAWGYLGLALERLGELEGAERAFSHGGHGQMARRMAARREGGAAAAPLDEVAPSDEVRAVAGDAYRELDAGELSFALADPTAERQAGDEAAQSWHPVELGNVRVDRPASKPTEVVPTKPPDTRDRSRPGPADAPMAASVPRLGAHHMSPNRRPTLIAPVGAPPAHELVASEVSAVDRIPSHQSPSFADEPPAPSYRHPVVSVPRPFGPPAARRDFQHRPTLSPPDVAPRPAEEPLAPPASPVALTQGPATPLGIGPEASPVTEAAAPGPSPSLRFPAEGVELHRSGVVLVQTTQATGFVARLESIRTQQSGLSMELLERHVKGRANGESFGGVASPMVRASGVGQMVLGARPGRKLFLFAVGSDMWFAREDVLLGFGGGLTFENGRLATGEGEFVPVVQLKGNGSVVFETIGEILTLPVQAQKSLNVRREVVIGWFGRLVPRAVAPNVAPCGQRGLLAFAGEGHVLVTSA
jgi:hypothetical protein